MRETSAGDRLGRIVPRRPAERNSPAAYLVLAVSQMPPLLLTKLGPVSRETSFGSGSCSKTDMETRERDSHQCQKFGQIIDNNPAKIFRVVLRDVACRLRFSALDTRSLDSPNNVKSLLLRSKWDIARKLRYLLRHVFSLSFGFECFHKVKNLLFKYMHKTLMQKWKKKKM